MSRASAQALVLLTTALCIAQTPHAGAAEPGPTFTQDVLPIFQDHCQDCHRPNQIAPMSLLSYQESRPWAKSIRNAVSSGIMPPFFAEAPLGHFQDDNRLTDTEIETILRWVDDGAPRGDPKHAPPRREWNRDGWTRGDPDLVLEFPEYTIKSTKTDEHILFFSDQLFRTHRWVEAFELKINDYSLVHHAGVYAVDDKFFVTDDLVLDSEDQELHRFGGDPAARLSLTMGQDLLFVWLPGQRVMPRTTKIGTGRRVVLQTHIPPMLEESLLHLSLGIWFENGRLDTHTLNRAVVAPDLVIPPGAENHEVTRWHKFGQDVTVLGFDVHMHLRGRSAQIRFHYPEGAVETVLDVPQFSFDWQRPYFLTKPMHVPGGTRIEYTAAWDNSTKNPLNPDPSMEVRWGERTVDEMYAGKVIYSVKRKKAVRVVDGRVIRPPK